MKQTNLLWLCLVLLLFSCSKEAEEAVPKPETAALIEEAQVYFQATQNTGQTATESSNPRTAIAKHPEWHNAYVKQASAVEVVVVPLVTPANAYYTLGNDQVKLPGKSYLYLYRQLNGQMTMEVVTTIPDATFITDGRKEKAFSGLIRVEEWDGSFIKAYRFSNGKTFQANSVIYSQTTHQTQAADDNIATNSWTTHCETTHYWYYVEIGGVASEPTYNGSETHCWYEYNGENTLLKRDDYGENTGGSGGSGGSSGDYLETRQSEPCVEKDKLSASAGNPTISAQNSQILSNTASSGKEYGAEQNLTTVPGSTYYNSAVSTDGSNNSFTPTFTWNSTSGYTIGVSHGHPANGAPSPADALWAYGNINNQELIRANGVAYYKDNVSVTVVTDAGIFIVTIKDWSALQNHHYTYYQNELAGKNIYAKYANEYETLNPSCTYQAKTAYALLKMYGDAINLYRAMPNSTNLEPLNINSQGVVAFTICL